MRRATFADVRADVARMRTWMALDRDGLGERLLKAFTDGVQGCFATSTDPEGNRWPDLSPDYGREKAFTHPGLPIGVRDGTLSDPSEVAGEVEVIDELAIVRYGRSDRAREEAAWFQEGDEARGRPPRPFWGLTAKAEAEMGKALESRLRSF